MPAAVAVPLIIAGASAGASAYAANRQSGAASEAANLQARSGDRSARMQQMANAQQLAFLRQQDTRQNAQYLEEQQYSRGNDAMLNARYLDEQAYLRDQRAQDLARREPFRRTSVGALSQLMNPIAQRPHGTVGDVLR